MKKNPHVRMFLKIELRKNGKSDKKLLLLDRKNIICIELIIIFRIKTNICSIFNIVE